VDFAEAQHRYVKLWKKVKKLESMTVAHGCTPDEVSTSDGIRIDLLAKMNALKGQFPDLRYVFHRGGTFNFRPPPPKPPRKKPLSDVEKPGFIFFMQWKGSRVTWGASTVPLRRLDDLERQYVEKPIFCCSWQFRNLKEAKQLNTKLRKQFEEYYTPDNTIWTLTPDLVEMILRKLDYYNQEAQRETAEASAS
jgi:hypothetical protein